MPKEEKKDLTLEKGKFKSDWKCYKLVKTKYAIMGYGGRFRLSIRNKGNSIFSGGWIIGEVHHRQGGFGVDCVEIPPY